jgi:hypothetical protein
LGGDLPFEADPGDYRNAQIRSFVTAWGAGEIDPEGPVKVGLRTGGKHENGPRLIMQMRQ